MGATLLRIGVGLRGAAARSGKGSFGGSRGGVVTTWITVVHGVDALVRDLKAVEQVADKEIVAELREAGAPVAEEWAARMSRYPGASLGTIGPRASSHGVLVTQSARKVTGLRPDFGALTMAHGIDALRDLENQIVDDVERRIDQMLKRHGL